MTSSFSFLSTSAMPYFVTCINLHVVAPKTMEASAVSSCSASTSEPSLVSDLTTTGIDADSENEDCVVKERDSAVAAFSA